MTSTIARGYVPPKRGQTEEPFTPKDFGFRKSCHSGWLQCAPYEPVYYDDWPFDAAEFIVKLAEENPELQVRICGVKPSGKIQREHFVIGDDFDHAQNLLYEFVDTTDLNIMFDPVPWSGGVRKEAVRLGWATVAGGHPFHLHPEPVIFWEVGSHAYQALVPWHGPVDIAESCETAAHGASVQRGAGAVSGPNELLFVPGSLIRSKGLPAFTATVVYDAFSVATFDEPHLLWTDY